MSNEITTNRKRAHTHEKGANKLYIKCRGRESNIWGPFCMRLSVFISGSLMYGRVVPEDIGNIFCTGGRAYR